MGIECYEYMPVFMIGEEDVAAYFKAISRHSAGWTEKN
jgi:hypothetical protein